MQKSALDKIDLRIIYILSKDCRMSYRYIGSVVGLTTKSAKARIDKMISNGVIEKFLVMVNPACFGYRTVCSLVIRNHKANKDMLNHLNCYDQIYNAQHLGGISVYGVAIKETSDEKINSFVDSFRPALVRFTLAKPFCAHGDLSNTDMRIIRCLLLNPRMQISEIVNELGFSAKTITRRLNIMKQNNVLKFSVLCNPDSTLGYIQFVIVIHVKKSFYHKVQQQIYNEFQENIRFQPPIVNPDHVIAFVLFGQDIFTVDSILNKIQSLEGVEDSELSILTKITYHNEWAIKEINQRLLSSLPSSKRLTLNEISSIPT